MSKRAMLVGSSFFVWSLVVAAQVRPPSKVDKIEPVAVVGCLQESKPNEWTLVNASDPVSSNPNAPSAKELAALPQGGKRAYQLIGVTIFNLPAYRGQTVIIKGLPIRAKPLDRLNVTSVSMKAPTCSGAAEKAATI
jgi:hypothetical protein